MLTTEVIRDRTAEIDALRARRQALQAKIEDIRKKQVEVRGERGAAFSQGKNTSKLDQALFSLEKDLEDARREINVVGRDLAKAESRYRELLRTGQEAVVPSGDPKECEGCHDVSPTTKLYILTKPPLPFVVYGDGPLPLESEWEKRFCDKCADRTGSVYKLEAIAEGEQDEPSGDVSSPVLSDRVSPN
jgi:hypothetical protein